MRQNMTANVGPRTERVKTQVGNRVFILHTRFLLYQIPFLVKIFMLNE